MKYRLPRINTCFKLGLLCLIIKTVFGTSNILRIEGIADDLLSAAGSVFLFVSVLKKGCRPITYCVYLALMVLAAYTSYKMGNLRMVMVTALCVAANRQRIDDVVRFLLSYETIFLLLHVLLALATSLFGKNNSVYMSGEMKYTFGFGHPNTFSCLLTNLLIMWSWLNYDRLKTSHVLTQVFIVLFFYIFTGTRTILLTVFIFAILFFYLKVSKRNLNLLLRYIIPMAVVCHLIAIPLYIGGNPIAVALNKALSTRIKLGAYWYTQRGLSLLGQNIMDTNVTWDEVWQLAGSAPFDNIYTFLMINVGMVWLLVLSVLFYRTSLLKNAKYNLFLILWALYGVTEVHGINPVMLFPLLILAIDVKKEKSETRLAERIGETP